MKKYFQEKDDMTKKKDQYTEVEYPEQVFGYFKAVLVAMSLSKGVRPFNPEIEERLRNLSKTDTPEAEDKPNQETISPEKEKREIQ